MGILGDRLMLNSVGPRDHMVAMGDVADPLRAAGVNVRVAKTGEAVDFFNRLQRECASIIVASYWTR